VSLVIDSSMTLAWYFEDEKTAASIAILNRVAEEGAVVPALWRLEVLNGLQVAVRRGPITIAYRDASLNDLRSLVIRSIPAPIARRGRQPCGSVTASGSPRTTRPISNWHSAANFR
jgi:predicted nucleic acid-binding protein